MQSVLRIRKTGFEQKKIKGERGAFALGYSLRRMELSDSTYLHKNSPRGNNFSPL